MQIERLKRGRLRGATAGAVSLLLAALAAAWLAPGAYAVEVTSLYTVEVPLDPDDSKAKAYRTALAEVLIRVTGDTAAARSKELIDLFPNPDRLVLRYREGPDDSLVVSLDGRAIERRLRESGETFWSSDRPLTVVWLAVDWGLGDREIIAAEDPDGLPGDGRLVDRNRQLRERVQTVATHRGVPVVFPLLDAEDLENIGFADVWGGFDEPLLEASARYEAQSVLVARIRPADRQQPRWTWYVGEQRFGWPGQPEEAINQLADAMAARDAIRGDQEAEMIELTISGIHSVDAYGQVQQFMENLRIVEKLMLKGAASDRITYVIEVRGGPQRLENALAMNSMFERDESGLFIDGGEFPLNEQMELRTQSLQYRYRAAGPPATERGTGLNTDTGPES